VSRRSSPGCSCSTRSSRARQAFVRASHRDVGLFVALVSFFVPVVAPVGMTAAFFIGFTAPRSKNQEPWVVFEAEPDDERPKARKKRNVSAADISAALRQRTAQTAEFRFQAVLAIKQLPPRVGVSLLKLAQSDPSDEVRLYAFSRLERMRDDLETQIKKLNAALAHTDKEESARTHLRLAECYWELGYLGLAEGAVLDHALRSA
jgi:polysaccharide biosynthesis protein PelE